MNALSDEKCSHIDKQAVSMEPIRATNGSRANLPGATNNSRYVS